MSEKETNRRPEASTEDKMQELFRLMDEKAAQGTLVETEEDVSAQKEKVDTTPLSESETAAFEYNMMMMQYEAMLLDYQRREAEEGPEKGGAGSAGAGVVMWEQLNQAALRLEELETQLAQPETYENPDLVAALNREQKELTPLVETFHHYQGAQRELAGLTDLLSDPECRQLARAEYDQVKAQLDQLEQTLRQMLLPKDPMDGKNVFLEIRAGVGGEEAALFAADLYRMYAMYGEKQGWKLELDNVSQTELGGIKELSCLVEGESAYAKLKHESGVHRVQRVPETESGGRIHTSTCTVAVLPQVDEVEFQLNPADLRIDTFRASGAGGQHINKTESAIRVTHLPTGTVVECQDQRSQYKNKDRALSILRARLYEQAIQEQAQAVAGQRRSQVGSGMRNERIRTYNFPQGRVTDHRIGLTLYKLDAVMNGELEELVEGLSLAEQRERLKRSEDG